MTWRRSSPPASASATASRRWPPSTGPALSAPWTPGSDLRREPCAFVLNAAVRGDLVGDGAGVAGPGGGGGGGVAGWARARRGGVGRGAGAGVPEEDDGAAFSGGQGLLGVPDGGVGLVAGRVADQFRVRLDGGEVVADLVYPVVLAGVLEEVLFPPP